VIRFRLLLGASLLASIGCGGQPQPATTPAAPPPPPPAPAPTAKLELRVEPPASGISPSAPFPHITHRELENGLGLRVVERHVHPIVELRLVVRTGSAGDGEKPGLANVAGELLKVGGAGGLSPQKLVERAESLGTSLEVSTDRDSTRISLSVTNGDVDRALEILAAVALRPAFAPAEFTKLRTREVERVKSSARGGASWAAAMVLYREIFDIPTGVHPYSRYDAMPEELAKLNLADCRAWHKAAFVPANANLVIAGDITPDGAEAATKKWFGAWKGGAAPSVSISLPFPPKERAVFLVDRPGAAQSQIYVGMLGTERGNAEFPALATATQILGGPASGRLFIDVREKRSLAYSTGAWLNDVASGPGPAILSAGTQTGKTADAVAALLENLKAIGAERAPSSEELERSVRYLADGFVFKLETVGGVADLTSQLYVLGLADDYYDEYRRALRGLTLQHVVAAAARHFQKIPVIVVAGDGATLGAPLAKFGPVAVLDPEHGFALKKSYPKAP
jgi:predicted Zn-dependent peptidase